MTADEGQQDPPPPDERPRVGALEAALASLQPALAAVPTRPNRPSAPQPGGHGTDPPGGAPRTGGLAAALASLQPALAAAQIRADERVPDTGSARPDPLPETAPLAGALGAALANLQPALAAAQTRMSKLTALPRWFVGPPQTVSAEAIEVMGLDGTVMFVTADSALPLEASDSADPQQSFWLRQGYDEARRALAAASTGQTVRFQAAAQTRNGVPAWWNVVVSPLRSADGAVDAILIVSRDQSERAADEGPLRDALERLDLALQAGPVIGTWLWDVPADRMAGDSRFAQACGVDPAAAEAGLPVAHFMAAIHEDDRARVAAAIAHTTRTGGRFQAEYRIAATAGEPRWVEATGQCEMDAAGRPVRFPGVLVDIHDRVLAEHAAQTTHAHQTALLELGDALRDAPDAAAIAGLAAHAVGSLLAVDHAGYVAIDPQTGHFLIQHDWAAEGAAHHEGIHPPDSLFGGLLERLRGLDRMAEADLEQADWLAPDEAEAYRQLGIRALINLPLLRDGHWVGAMYATHPRPHDWTEDEAGFIHDVADRAWAAAERVLAEAAVAANAAELRMVADSMPVLISLIDSDFTYRFVNSASMDWLGLPPGDVIGRPVRDIVGADSFAWRLPYFAAALAGEPCRVEAHWPRTDGSERIAEIRYLPRPGTEGSFRGFYAFVLDITERKREEHARQRSAEALKAEIARRTADRDRMWQLSTDIMLVARFDGVIEAVNPAWTALLGWSESALVGSDLFALVHPDDHAVTRAEMARLEEGLRTVHFENRYRHSDGSTRWISWSAAPDAPFIHAAGRDVTLERDRAAQQHALEEQLRQSQKMEAVGQLTGGLAHDFNNLLTGIVGSLEILQERVAQGRLDGLDRYILGAQAAASRGAALTHRLLAFSRRQTLDPKPTSVNRLIAGMAELIQRTVGPSIRIETVLDGALWSTLCDPNQLENALLNLAINARDAMPDGGRLLIETVNASLDETAARALDMTPGGYVAMSVTDSGTGMTAEVAARAFDPFFTTKPAGEGTGLGLSMIYGFARQSGGQVRIESTPGRGTTLQLYLPWHAAEEMAEPPAEPAPAPPAGLGETVLVVDDEMTVRMLVAEVLGEQGYETIEAADGAAGLAALRAHPAIDLLITDLGLPGGMDGRALAEAARAVHPAMGVLFITGYDTAGVASRLTVGPPAHIIPKPFTMDALAVKIRAMLGKGQPGAER